MRQTFFTKQREDVRHESAHQHLPESDTDTGIYALATGNFHIKKLSPIKCSCQKICVPATPNRSNMHTLYTAMKNFVYLIFVHNRAYEYFLTTKISRTTVYSSCYSIDCS